MDQTPSETEPKTQPEMGADTPFQTADTLQTSPDHAGQDDELTRLHPNHVKALRLTAIITMIPFLIAALVGEVAEIFPWPGVILGPIAVLAMFIILRLPMRRHMARGYQMGEDRLRVVSGIWWRSDTVVPFGRVQHIDVEAGPIERSFGIATMTLHTAGSHNASVHLPGLEEQLARDMREDIRQHIKRDTI